MGKVQDLPAMSEEGHTSTVRVAIAFGSCASRQHNMAVDGNGKVFWVPLPLLSLCLDSAAPIRMRNPRQF